MSQPDSLSLIQPQTDESISVVSNRCRQRGMAGRVPLRGSRLLVPRAWNVRRLRSTDFMTSYFPTLRGWIAFLLAVFAALLFPLICPPLRVQSGVGTFLAEPVGLAALIAGPVFILVCSLASAEAFWRGTRADKIFALVAVLLTIGLLVEYLRLFGLSVYQSPNTLEPTATAR